MSNQQPTTALLGEPNPAGTARRTQLHPFPARVRRMLWLLTLGAVAGVVLIPLNPVSDTAHKLAWLAALGSAWFGVWMLGWRWRIIRFGWTILPFTLGALGLLPGREIDRDSLRADYVSRLTGLTGTKYFWGGESRRGIDCSGLPRKALRDALVSYAIRRADGGALRMAIGQWWFDASAKALGNGYRGYTNALRPTGTVRTLDSAGLEPGDLAVATSGVHVMVYVGANRWIQADPGAGRVIELDGRTADNAWFNVPVTTHRWQVLEGR